MSIPRFASVRFADAIQGDTVAQQLGVEQPGGLTGYTLTVRLSERSTSEHEPTIIEKEATIDTTDGTITQPDGETFEGGLASWSFTPAETADLLGEYRVQVEAETPTGQTFTLLTGTLPFVDDADEITP